MKKSHILFSLLFVIMLTGCCQHEWGGGTCISPVVCQKCGKSGKDMGKHSWSTKVIEEPTCTKEGKSETYCVDCGLVSFTSSIKPVPHNYEKSKVLVAPGCHEEGVDLHICTVCGAESEVKTPAAGHDYGYDYALRKANCTETGLLARKCNRCKEVEIVQEFPALGHNLGKKITIKMPTCTVAGTTERHCSRCDYVLTEDTFVLGHNFVGAVVTKNPSCENVGYIRYRCSFCGEYKFEDIPAIGHNYSAISEHKDPECESPGYEVRYCQLCNKKDVIEFPATGHRFINDICTGCGIRIIPEIVLTEDDIEEIALIDSISDVKAVYNGERFTFSYVLRDKSGIGRKVPAVLTLYVYDINGDIAYQGVHEIKLADSRVRWTQDGSYQYNAIKIIEGIELQPKGLITEFGSVEFLIEIPEREGSFGGRTIISRY